MPRTIKDDWERIEADDSEPELNQSYAAQPSVTSSLSLRNIVVASIVVGGVTYFVLPTACAAYASAVVASQYGSILGYSSLLEGWVMSNAWASGYAVGQVNASLASTVTGGGTLLAGTGTSLVSAGYRGVTPIFLRAQPQPILDVENVEAEDTTRIAPITDGEAAQLDNIGFFGEPNRRRLVRSRSEPDLSAITAEHDEPPQTLHYLI